MAGFITSAILFWGYAFAAQRIIRGRQNLAPFFVVSVLGVTLFFLARFNLLWAGTKVLYGLGALSAAWSLIVLYRKKDEMIEQQLYLTAALFLGFLIFSFLVTMGMRFTVIDDYVYWGIMGKYLHFFNHLPDADTTIIRRHLSYTPGTSLIHYYFYPLFGGYKASVSYFAQNFILISPLFAVIKNKDNDVKKNLTFLFSAAILLGLFCGSVFAKLQVDYLLSAYLFAILWVWFYTPAPTTRTLIYLSFPILFLSLIKEIGFLLSLVALVMILLDVICFEKASKPGARRIKAFIVVALAVLLMAIKFLWQSHCEKMGFAAFSGAINKETILAALNIFSDPAGRKGFIIFIKGLFFNGADRLNLPYIVWYVLIVVLTRFIYQRLHGLEKKRFLFSVLTLCGIFIIYIMMNYFMQMIVFKIGRSYLHTVGLERYLNIMFVPWVMLLILKALELSFLKKNRAIQNKVVVALGVVFLLLVGISRIQSHLSPEPGFLKAELLAKKIETKLDPQKQLRIAIIPGIKDNDMWIQMLYYLFPNKINHGRFPAGTKDLFLNTLSIYDYVYIESISPDMKNWLAKINPAVSSQSFYRVVKMPDEAAPDVTFQLQKEF